MTTNASAPEPVRLTAEDRFMVQDLLARYNWAVDTDDADAFADAFAADGEFVTAHKVFTGHAELRELMAYLRSKRAKNERSLMHNAFNLVVEPHVDGVRLVAQLLGPRITDDGEHTLQLGWYDDRIVKTPAGWRFARRHFREWDEHTPVTSPVPFWTEADKNAGYFTPAVGSPTGPA